MKEMTEPLSTATGAAIGLKLVSPAVLGAAIASTVVMLMTMPKTKKQQAVALLTTFAVSIFGGAFILDYWHLHEVLSNTSLGGVYLLAGLPAWVIIRGFFAYTERDKNKGLLDYVREVRQAWKGSDTP